MSEAFFFNSVVLDLKSNVRTGDFTSNEVRLEGMLDYRGVRLQKFHFIMG